MGYAKTAVVIAQNEDILFLKYIEIGGRTFDEAVARHSNSAAARCRRPCAATMATAGPSSKTPKFPAALPRPSGPWSSGSPASFRYAFAITALPSAARRWCAWSRRRRGHAAAGRIAGQALCNLKSELSDPFRCFASVPQVARRGSWDVAAGLAYRTVNDMKNIDFLPSRYRVQAAAKNAQWWRLVVIGLFGSGIGLASLFQWTIHRAVNADLAVANLQYEECNFKNAGSLSAQDDAQLERS